MKSTKLFLLLLLPFFLFSQEKEKRLALVIGNANYDKGELKNPVNDERLIASTLDSLDFDVILKENLSTKRDMTAAIREFGSRRSEYDVAFVYYAGHGVQVDDENFLLPTKETFEEEFDVMDYGVSVQNIMRYLRAQTNQVNILILDACRDNPFESSWGNTRSLKGQGLAKIPPPTGSLIAFSTDSGQTAPDGDGENSIYSISLAKNMLLKDTSIDQVFRNVRSEVLKQTDGGQRPVEATQLTGRGFYLLRENYELMFPEIMSLMDDKKYLSAIEILTGIIPNLKNNAEIFYFQGVCYVKLGKYSESLVSFNKSIEIDPLFAKSLYAKGLLLLNHFDNHNELEKVLKRYIEVASSLEAPNFYKIISALSIMEESYVNNNFNNEIILEMWNDYVMRFPNIPGMYFERALFFTNILDEPKKAIEDYDKVIELGGDISTAYNNLGNILKHNGDYEKAIKYYNKAIDIDPQNPVFYMRLAGIQNKINDDKLEAIRNIKKAIELDPDHAYNHYVLSSIYLSDNKIFEAFKSIENAILLDPNNHIWFGLRGNYNSLLGDHEAAIVDYTKAIDLHKLNLGKVDKFSGFKFRADQGYGMFLSDLFVDRAKIFKEINDIIGCCNDYNSAIKTLAISNGWKESEYSRDEIEKLILENCSN